ncbi:Glyoxalase/Bleomycin resistance protein/Dioxygenase superfamily protein [Aquisphaera giovannonii]|uniref:Glyoxalase/Bleomycin resistance protein/Dioxygenase superfamily protein n=1 Tax=Aquisphaera giovannonii TaxID=406548 RepID=A0A5B9WCZ2_9BACT|nr:VOC family protein [Aquisphaera giovannonii]QEH38538.1 Glyoxalase/Bleomycin resistance protein/Dioxygenase superfamily protein [Aquisphaera giovannonii]
MAQASDKAVVEQPRPITHVGVTVTDIDAAIDWYRRVLGFQLLHGPVDYTAGEGYFGRLVADMLGPKVVRGRIAMLDAGNSVGLELFEFSEPKPDRRVPEENQEFYLHKTGTFHFCVVDPDIEGLARRIVEAGGRQRSAVWEFAPGVGFYVCYCEDPFGNIVEIYSHGTAHIWSTLAQMSK